jgi:hypothetical protein
MAQLPDALLSKEKVRRLPGWRQQWLRLLFWELTILVAFFIAGLVYLGRALWTGDGAPLGVVGIFIIEGAILGAIFHRLRHIREDLRTYRG